MKPYLVSDGVYPFDNIIDVVYVEEQDDKEAEATTALAVAKSAKHRTGVSHPTVEPLHD